MFRLFSRKPYRIGVAFGGGGARGFAHVGALKAMEEVGIRPDIVAGVSAGAVIAVMYAAGLSPADIIRSFDGKSFSDFCEWGIPKAGFLGMEGFKRFIRSVTGVERIEQLPIPTLIGATDIDRGCPAVFDSGEIGDRVAASCSIPVVFRPQVIDGRRYVDGGVLRNLPAWVLRDKVEYLFGINVSPLRHREVSPTVIDTAMRSYELVTKTNTIDDMKLCDLAVCMDAIADYKVFNLKEIKRVYQVGYINMMEALLDNGFRRHAGRRKPTRPDMR